MSVKQVISKRGQIKSKIRSKQNSSR